MPKYVPSASGPWLVSSARKNELLQHPSLKFRFQKRQADLHEVTHVADKQSDGEGWIDTAAAVASFLFPELTPAFLAGAHIGKKFLKKKKEPKHDDHDVVTRRGVPAVARAPPTSAVQANLVAAMRQNPRPLQSASNPVRFAPMPGRLDVGDVPVLHGQSGHMPLMPVSVQRTESHAAMAGSEYLDTLQLNTSQVGVGLNVLTIPMNPRNFAGTKLTAEARTWTMYRFRRFVLEYIPIQGSSVTGSFVGYFTNDPFEPDVGGVQAVRNAVEHTNSLMWQPFFHSLFAFTDDEADKHLYFCQNVEESDPRFEIQAVFKTVQNISNTTAVPFGSFIMHYEVDFYYPETVATVGAMSWPAAGSFSNATSVLATKVRVESGTPFTSEVHQGCVLQAIMVTVPANSGGARYLGTSQAPAAGTLVYLVPMEPGSTPDCYIYNNLGAADQGTNIGALYWPTSGTIPAVGVAWSFQILSMISHHELAALRTTSGGPGLKTLLQDETQEAEDPDWAAIHADHCDTTTTTNPLTTQLPDLEAKRRFPTTLVRR